MLQLYAWVLANESTLLPVDSWMPFSNGPCRANARQGHVADHVKKSLTQIGSLHFAVLSVLLVSFLFLYVA